ncbi:MAG: hypothetical protein ACREI2_04485 [Nitrospiraceae bacterium]
MKKLAVVMAWLVLWGCQTDSPIHDTEPLAELLTSESTTVTGEVLEITGTFYLTQDAQGREVFDAKDEIYVVREETGNEVPVHVDEKTKVDLDRRVSTGDEIEATLSPDGHAVLIKPAS